ncbi:MAG: IS3 family transposase [Spirochaetales bacterium]|nr:IS3 family transposase [Spirochaetales bacterium]
MIFTCSLVIFLVFILYSRRSPNGLTKADKKAQRPDNVLKRDFSATRPNEKWLTDITEVPCSDGKLYVAPVFDCFGGEIVSIAMENHMKKELCIQAIDDAYKSRTPGSGVLIHSDAGSQYTSDRFKKLLGSYRAIQSMSDVGKCYDNARMESFFATLKKEKLLWSKFPLRIALITVDRETFSPF